MVRIAKERFHEAAEVPTSHRSEHGTHDRAQHPQEARREPRAERGRCECPFLGRHAYPFLALADRILSACGGGSEKTVGSGGEHPPHVALDASLKIVFAETRFRR